jgi:hypothetical protein
VRHDCAGVIVHLSRLNRHSHEAKFGHTDRSQIARWDSGKTGIPSEDNIV